MLKLKIGAGTKAAQQGGGASGSGDGDKTPQTPGASTPGGGGIKLKLNFSQPPTPIEPGPSSLNPPASAPAEKKKRAYTKKATDGAPKGKKRALEDDSAAPAAKRKISLKLGGLGGQVGSAAEASASPKITLGQKKTKTQPRLVDIRARGKVPPRPKGVGYDSEDSETEKDPAVQQALILRMQPGPDAEYIRNAIAEGRIGPSSSGGDAEVSIKFLERNYRRAYIKVQGRMYGAVLVDLPCIVESMKSFDKKGWWKVADIAQMLLVLGRCDTEEQVKMMPLPREVNKENYQYAHGITPPMHWARKRRFRKRLNYNEAMNVEEEVNRLLQADKEWEERGGSVTSARIGELQQQQQQERHEDVEMGQADQQNGGYSFEFGDEDAEGEDAIETVEHDDMEEGDPDLEAGLQAMFDENEDEADASQLISDSPAPIADQGASLAAAAMQSDIDATPVGTPAAEQTQDEQSDDEDESDEDEDSPDVVDEDAAAKAAERAQQLEEVADLEREVERAKYKVNSMSNQLLQQRERKKLAALEEELAVKKQVFGLDMED